MAYLRNLVELEVLIKINMSKLRVGHKENSFLNGEWASHIRKLGKKWTAKKRRRVDKETIKKDNNGL